MAAIEIWTIGHSNLPLETFIGLLKMHHIQALADVRRFPGSRRYPHFNAEALNKSLALSQIEYVHFPELGGRRPVQPNSPNTVWRNEAFRGYADYMASADFGKGIARLLELAKQKRTAIMCAEVLWWQCHRSLVADFLKAQQVKVFHILGENKVEEHPYTSAARIVEGKLSYAASSQPELSL